MTPLLLVLALDPCALTDHACRARDYEARAHEAGIPHETKVRRLYLAHRELLFNFDATGNSQALCEARKALAAVRAAKPTPPDMVPRLDKTTAEAAERERQAGLSCAPPRSSTTASTTRKFATRPSAPPRKLAPLPAPVPVPQDSAELLAVPTGRPRVAPRPPAASQVAEPRRDDLASGPEHSGGPTVRMRSTPSPTSIRPSTPVDNASRPRDGRGLLVAGGVMLATAAGLGSASLYGYLAREDLVRRERALVAHADELGYADASTVASQANLLGDARQAHRLMLGAGISSGLTAGAALVTLALGAHRRHLHPRRVEVSPTLGGLLLLGRF